MDKIDILKRKLGTQYDEEFAMENVIPTEEQFNAMADAVRAQMKFQFTDAEFFAARDQIRETREASLGIVVSLDDTKSNHDLEWFTKFCAAHPERNKFIHRFNMYMSDAKHWSDESVKELSRNADQIVNRLGDPNSKGLWKRKGLVIGDVQSGKTANYTAVCNKAVDAGYKVIIVLAGRTNTLRKQTQKRLESDFVGLKKNDAHAKQGEALPSIPVGVGLYEKVTDYWVEAETTNVTDFTKRVADSKSISFNEHMTARLFVVKKVKSVLDNLDSMFGTKPISVPMLLIDDEADDASVNTKTEDSPTAINACIRKILAHFTRSTYLAVTATPFANILINPHVEGSDQIDKDLFPEDFICCLTTPSEYIGSEKMFRDDSEMNYVIPILENDVAKAFPFKHKKTQIISEMPSSLKDAIRYFAITNAVRDILGHSKTHRSMMINVSRFVDVQNRLKSKVQYFWEEEVMLYIKSYSHMGTMALGFEQIAEIKKLYEKFGIENTFHITWEDIQECLYEANKDVRIVAVNQKSADVLDYEKYEAENNDGMRVIAIGGDCLSRGLTLEDLCVTYFYRNSQMYDTLMQMGRWFGFRPGYAKLVKVWMAEDAVGWYTHISEATEELKRDVYRMNRGNLTPMDFGYRIKGHPDSLIPTARAKMKSAKLDVAYEEIDVSGHLIESPRLYDSVEEMNHNETQVRRLIEKVSGYGQVEFGTTKKNPDLIIRNVAAGDVADLVGAFHSKLWNFYYESSRLAEGIRESNDIWNVIVVNGPQESSFQVKLADGEEISIGAQRRQSTWDGKELKINGSKVKVGAGGCTVAGLRPGISFSEVEKEWKSQPAEFCKKVNKRTGKEEYKDIPDDFILHLHKFVDKPMLLIHNMEIVSNQDGSLYNDGECYVMALGLGFPSSDEYGEYKRNPEKQTKVRVYLNTIAQELANEEGDDVVSEDL